MLNDKVCCSVEEEEKTAHRDLCWLNDLQVEPSSLINSDLVSAVNLTVAVWCLIMVCESICYDVALWLDALYQDDAEMESGHEAKSAVIL